MEWGTEEELYRHKCMMLLAHRYQYYVLSKPVIQDTAYDLLEKELEKYETEHPEMAHPCSPTKSLGSSNPSDYPSSIRRYFGEPEKRDIPEEPHFVKPKIKTESKKKITKQEKESEQETLF